MFRRSAPTPAPAALAPVIRPYNADTETYDVVAVHCTDIGITLPQFIEMNRRGLLRNDDEMHAYVKEAWGV